MKPIVAALLSAASLATFSTAGAALVDLDQQQPGSTFGTPNWSREVTRVIGTDTKTLRAGAFRLNDQVRDILAYCIEPGIPINLDEQFDTMIQSSPWASVFTDIDKLFTSSYDKVDNAAKAAGFQLAIWEIVAETDSTYDLTSGNHRITQAGNAVLSAATTYLAALGAAGTGGFKYTTYVNSGQDLISVDPVPVPAAAVLFGSVLGGLALRRRQRR